MQIELNEEDIANSTSHSWGEREGGGEGEGQGQEREREREAFISSYIL